MPIEAFWALPADADLLARALVEANLDSDASLLDLLVAMDRERKEPRDEARGAAHRERPEDASQPLASGGGTHDEAGSPAVRPDPRYLDVVNLQSVPLQALLRALIAVRCMTSVELGRGRDSYLFDPINPLLLITAIATALVKGQDRGALLAGYVAGFSLYGGYDHLLRLPEYPDELLAEHLQIEEELTEHFCVLSLSSGAADPIEETGPPSSDAASWRDHWLRLNARADGGDPSAQGAREGVRWGTWLLANPALFRGGPIEYIQGRLYDEGIVHNTQIHVALEELEQLAPRRDAHFNALLRRNLDVDVNRKALTQARAERALAARVLDRARRFYIWNPSEIEARRGVARFDARRAAARSAAAAKDAAEADPNEDGR